jgi:hypothetical protein
MPKIFSLPKEEWEKIAEQTRVTYLDEFRTAMAGIKEKN